MRSHADLVPEIPTKPLFAASWMRRQANIRIIMQLPRLSLSDTHFINSALLEVIFFQTRDSWTLGTILWLLFRAQPFWWHYSVRVWSDGTHMPSGTLLPLSWAGLSCTYTLKAPGFGSKWLSDSTCESITGWTSTRYGCYLQLFPFQPLKTSSLLISMNTRRPSTMTITSLSEISDYSKN